MRQLKWLCWLSALVVGLFVERGQAQDKKDGKPKAAHQRWAILIGVDDYAQAQDLQYCGADQRAFRERLIKSGFDEDNVFLLHDEAKEKKYLPFKANIEKQLDLLLGLLEKDDIVVLAFSGHGLHFGGKSYICPTDAKLDDPNSLVSMDSVYDRLKKSPAAFKLVVVDACRNDPRPGGQRSLTATDGTRQFAQALERPPEGLVLLNSCAPGEISWEEKEFGHGVFMHFLMDGLSGQADENGDGKVSLSELSQYAGRKTKLHVAKKFNDSQRPFLKGDLTLEAMDFDFGKAVAKVSTTPSNPPSLPKSTPTLPANATKTLTNSIGMKLALIPAGEFEMGEDSNAHRVRISQPFYLGVYEVTQSQYERVMGMNPSWFSKTGGGKDKVSGLDTSIFPVEKVSWNDAKVFCRKLSELSGERTAGYEYRMPTEAEWEYACRAGTNTTFHFGDELNGDKANVNGNSPEGTKTKGPFLERTTTVGRYAANAFGLYDMHGNVWEWCEDVYDEKAYSKTALRIRTDPLVTSGSLFYVLRGGSWGLDSRSARSALRNGNFPGKGNLDSGFRVVAVAIGGKTIASPNDQIPTASIKPLPANAPKTLTNSIEMKFALIPAGEFEMGYDKGFEMEKPVHRVRISNPFYFGVYEVTQAQYERVMGKNPSHYSKTGDGRDRVAGLDTSDCPVDNVRWDDARYFCTRLSALTTEKNNRRSYRLPTEAEWEYSCRAGTKTRFHFGDVFSAEKANLDGRVLNRTTSVGKYAPNAFGLFDMHGNVAEWCEDVFDEKAYLNRGELTLDPLVKSGSAKHVLRGGMWGYTPPTSASSAIRITEDPAFPIISGTGIRVVCVVSP